MRLSTYIPVTRGHLVQITRRFPSKPDDFCLNRLRVKGDAAVWKIHGFKTEHYSRYNENLQFPITADRLPPLEIVFSPCSITLLIEYIGTRKEGAVFTALLMK